MDYRTSKNRTLKAGTSRPKTAKPVVETTTVPRNAEIVQRVQTVHNPAEAPKYSPKKLSPAKSQKLVCTSPPKPHKLDFETSESPVKLNKTIFDLEKRVKQNIQESHQIITTAKVTPDVAEKLQKNAKRIMNENYNDFIQSVEI